MIRWEYKILEFRGIPDEIGILSKEPVLRYIVKSTSDKEGKVKIIEKKVTKEDIERIFNEIGREGWELVEIVPFVRELVQFVFKRKNL